MSCTDCYIMFIRIYKCFLKAIKSPFLRVEVKPATFIGLRKATTPTIPLHGVKKQYNIGEPRCSAVMAAVNSNATAHRGESVTR